MVSTGDVIALLVFAGAGGLLVALGVRRWRAATKYARLQPVTARVVDVSTRLVKRTRRVTRHGQRVNAQLEVRIWDSRVEWAGPRGPLQGRFELEQPHQVGQTLTLHVDPDDPARAKLLPPAGSLGQRVFALGCIGLGLVVFAAKAIPFVTALLTEPR